MATIKFLLQSKSENSQIYIRLSAGRDLYLKKKTGFSIDFKNWSDKTNFPKQNIDENKALLSKLKKLENFVFDKHNLDMSKDVLIDSNWLGNCINECFNRVIQTDNTIFVNYIQFLIDSAPTKETRGGKIGLSKGTIKNYNMFKGIIEEYQKSIKKKIQFKDINKAFTEKFKLWLLNEKGYTVNYAGKQFEFIKTVCLDARKNEIDVTAYSITLKAFREQDNDRYIHTLSLDELDMIYNTEMPTEHLKEVKKWILIGCYIGQRGGDLLNLKPENIRVNAKGVYIDLIQQKTSKNVTIGVVKDYVLDILLNDFPKQVSLNKINTYISKVCEIAKINEVVKGYIIDKNGKRKQTNLPKYEFITSHSLRRSFATNFYKKIPTPILIGITGHSTESMFLKYINQRADKDGNADMFMSFFEQLNKDKTPELKVLKSGTNN
ncbi:integrase [Flavobacterium davisii]|uniref:Integrase n=1 Tax=Flavobacterium davisii TaxID=2906077 RepID=A0A246GNF8_9FLAO|nr:phage integrase SAM-like domain-containing protein [Flavobacterium davisii]OWP85278.1 integrase [Flavobacterium davisii]